MHGQPHIRFTQIKITDFWTLTTSGHPWTHSLPTEMMPPFFVLNLIPRKPQKRNTFVSIYTLGLIISPVNL